MNSSLFHTFLEYHQIFFLSSLLLFPGIIVETMDIEKRQKLTLSQRLSPILEKKLAGQAGDRTGDLLLSTPERCRVSCTGSAWDMKAQWTTPLASLRRMINKTVTRT